MQPRTELSDPPASASCECTNYHYVKISVIFSVIQIHKFPTFVHGDGLRGGEGLGSVENKSDVWMLFFQPLLIMLDESESFPFLKVYLFYTINFK